MAPTEHTRTRPATSQEDLADTLACALLWVDLAAMSLHADDLRRSAQDLGHARTHLRTAIRRLKHQA